MIFKTFDSDIDNMSSRWGMFGKSFSDIGDTITTKWKQVTDYVAVTNDATISGMMSAWKGTSPVQFLSDDSVVNILNDYNKALDAGAEKTAKFLDAGTGNDFMDDWLKQLNDAPAIMDDYKAAVAKAELSQNGLTASMVASKVAALALNVAVSMGISIAISALIKLVDNLVHANEKAIEKAEELRDKYNDFKETNASNVKTLNGLKDEFEELSDGVSQYGDNISLTTEQYARYQEIVQQIVGMSPSLAEGYDTENGYIADKNGLLERAIKLQEIEYKNELRKITNLDNLKTSMSGYIAEYKEALNGGHVTSEGNIIGTTIDTDFKNSLWKVFNTNNRDNYDGQSMAKDIMKSLGVKNVDKEIEKYINKNGAWQDNNFWNDYCDKIVSNLDVVTNSLTAEEVGLDDTVFEQNIEKLESYAEQYNDMKDSVKSANESIQTDLGYIAEYADGYSDLSKEQQKFVTDYLKGFDISDITSENSMGILEYDEDKMASVKSQIKKFVEELSHDGSTKQALTDLYVPPSDNKTIEEYKNRIDSALEVIRKYCETNGIEIPVGISDVEDSATGLESSYKQTIENAKEKYGEDLTPFFKENSINTQEEIDKWREIAQSCDTATEAKKKYLEADTSEETPIYATDFKTLNDSLSSLTNNAELLSKVNKEISNTGIISAENLKKINEAFPEDKYPELTKSLYEYQLGLINTTELFDELEKCYNQDANSYAEKNYNKLETTNEFLDKVRIEYPDFFNYLSDLYQGDLGNYENIAELKKEIDTTLVSALNNLWANHYELVQDKATGLYNAIIDDQAMLDGTISEEESDNILNGISDEVERANSALTRLNEIKNSYVNQISDNASWQSLGKDLSSSNDSSSSQTAEKLNWIERLINKISTAYSHLKNVVSDTTSTWLNRNNALSDSMSTLRDEINAQSQAYEYYINAFNGYDLDDYYKNQIANGSISIDVIYDEDLKNAISDCQDFYDKAQDAKTAVQELGIELKGLAKSRFDNLKSQYEEQINQITKTNDLLQKEADIIDTKGWFASTLLNNSFIEQEQKNLNKLKEERTALVNALNSAIDSGKIEEYSEDWYDMQSSIDDCTSSILDAEKALIEYDNAIRQINWDAFDRTRDDVEDLINETDFLVELLKDVGITDDNGNMTKEGQAAQALLAQKYQLYLNQAKAYKDEISKINEDLANDPYDKELLDRKQDLIDKEQEAIKSAMSEKDAIKDLTNDAYTDFIDKLGDAIDKYKELMDTMKDAYDYEKSIREKTEALNALEKQYSAYQGDNSEEGKKNIQQLKDQINTAKDNLKDTEYEKLISDTEKILDDLKDDVQSWVDQRLDQLDDLIQDIIEQSNENASDISQTINSTAENYGYNLSKPLLFSAKNVNYGKFN